MPKLKALTVIIIVALLFEVISVSAGLAVKSKPPVLNEISRHQVKPVIYKPIPPHTPKILPSSTSKICKPQIEKVIPTKDQSNSPLKTVLEWKELEFLFPNATARNQAIADQSYIRGNSVPIDVAVDYGVNGQRIFITVPRFQIGRPITLGTVVTDRKPLPGGPLLRPYPDYSWHVNPTRCEGMVSVFRVAIDPCGRIWLLDSGRIGPVQHCPPQLLVFDLKTDKLVHRYRFQVPIYRQLSAFVTPILDVRDDTCENVFVYIADVGGFGLIVYDHARNTSWRIDNKLFYPFPSSGTHRIANEQFELMDGIVGMALGPLIDDERYLYFHALASLTENRVATSIIRNSTIFQGNTRASPLSFQVYKGKRSSQSVASALDSSGRLYFGINEDVALGCWHIDNPYGGHYIQKAARDNTTLQFISGIKVVSHRETERVWMVTNRFQKYMTGTYSNSTVNFRVMTGDVKQLSKGCHRRFDADEINDEDLFSNGETDIQTNFHDRKDFHDILNENYSFECDNGKKYAKIFRHIFKDNHPDVDNLEQILSHI